ncbi:MAG: hypothetical protein ACRELF_24055 [Gemmataceae bacterium]
MPMHGLPELLSSRGERLRSPGARALLAAALTISLLLGGSFLAVGRLHSSPADFLDHPRHIATDDQTKTEVVEQAKHIVAIARLQKPTAGYLLMSCRDHDDPPYQGAIFMNFTLPTDARAHSYFQAIAAAMVARGWNQGLPPNQHVNGKALSKDGVTAILYQDSDYPNRGIARLYGQCRNMNNHRGDPTAWVDITDQLQ